MRRILLVLAGALSFAARDGAAQETKAGALEFGLFGRATFDYGEAFDASTGFGIGGRAGVALGKRLALEFDVTSVNSTTEPGGISLRDFGTRPRLAYGIPVGEKHRLILGAGYSTTILEPEGSAAESAPGLGLLAGWRYAVNERVGLRFDFTRDKWNGSAIHGVHFGLSFPITSQNADPDADGVPTRADKCAGTPAGDRVDARGCSLPKDADGDGVVDASDRCSSTPAGTAVDATGCPRDTDSDGVVDASDRCANTPAGTQVDANGCPRDTDSDGVVDTADQCPATPAGTAVDARGCPRDTDGDGVADATDQCGNTPAGARVGATGCPLPDADSDGVPDVDDRCANTPARMQVDARGCQMLFAEPAPGAAPGAAPATIVLQGVTFASGSANLTDASRPVLDRVAEALVANPTIRVEVQGHTDNSGSVAGNTRISQARANAVRDYLISKGVAAANLTAVGYGPNQPKVPNTTPAGRAENRRVELKRLP